jgi:hypothetical protein
VNARVIFLWLNDGHYDLVLSPQTFSKLNAGKNNGGRFDTVFLLRELLVERKIVAKCIMNGNKIMCIELEDRNLKVIDSFFIFEYGFKEVSRCFGYSKYL